MELKVTVPPSGQLQVPEEVVRQDHISPGDQFTFRRLGNGKYQLTREVRQDNRSLVDILLNCPEKNWFVPLDRTETTDDVVVPEL